MKTVKIASLLFGVMLSTVSVADDTDIYLNPHLSVPPNSEPLVMFSLDYRPNLGSTACQGYPTGDGTAHECDILGPYLPATGPYVFFDVLRGALRKVMEPLTGVRVGLMLNHNHNNNCQGPLPPATRCSNGGMIAMGFQLFDATDSNGAKARFHQILASIPTPQGGQSHSYQGKELFFEFHRYLTGTGIYNGHNGWTDYFTDTTLNLPNEPGTPALGPPPSWDTTVENGRDYISPLAAIGSCTKIYTVNPMFQVSNQEADSDNEMLLATSVGGFGGSYREFPDVIRYMYDADIADGTYGNAPNVAGHQNVTSYFLLADPFYKNNTGIGYARAGGTGAPLELSENPEELVNILQDIFRQILSTSTTFVAASVPVNVFNRAEIVDNVYIALFKVDENGRPWWPGNMKKLRLGEIDGSTQLLDALNNPAVAGDGRIRPDALTFWTNSGALPPADTAAGEIDGRDGRFVDRGGAGQKVPGFLGTGPGLTNGWASRRVFYDGALGLANLNADVITATALQTDLGATDLIESDALIKFLRGLDVDDIDGDGNSTEAREWVFADPLHSRPLPINYGARGGYSETNPAIYIAVASNDGLLHFVRNTDTGGSDVGQESWAFAPRATMGAARTLRANASAAAHPYTVDGAPVAYIADYNNNGTVEVGEKAYLYFGLRRGGKAYYALDVSNPEAPSLLWTIDKSGDFAELGMTFSTPRVGSVNLGSGPQPVLIFAGGYDVNKDTRGVIGTNDNEGNAIYVVDAETGALIWKAVGGTGASTSTVFQHPNLLDSIPSTVAIADSDGNFLTDRIVVGDTGGNVWRADIGGANTAAWKLTRLAALGRHSETGKINDRRFFHRPDIVQTEDDTGAYDAVVIGSGDRPDPLDLGGVVSNWFYMIKDRNVAPTLGADLNLMPSQLGDVTDNCIQENGMCTADLTNGWRLELEIHGEKSLATPLTIAGRVFFTSYVPSGSATASNTCAPPEGQGYLYAVSLQNASSVVNYDTTDDDPNYPGDATTKADRRTELNSPGIPAEVVSIPPNQILRPDLLIEDIDVSTRWRTFWYLSENTDL